LEPLGAALFQKGKKLRIEKAMLVIGVDCG
jgi:hypothetical protein